MPAVGHQVSLLVPSILYLIQLMFYPTLMNKASLEERRPSWSQDPLKSLSVQSLLNGLSKALRISLSVYESVYLADGPKIDSVTCADEQEAPPSKSELAHLGTSLKDQEMTEVRISIPEKQLTKEQIRQLDPPKFQSEKQDIKEVVLEAKSEPLFKKAGSNGNKMKTAKTFENCQIYSSHFLKIDLVETAYLPSLGLDRNEIQKRKQNLLNRRVYKWDEKELGRRDKREIRMLNN